MAEVRGKPRGEERRWQQLWVTRFRRKTKYLIEKLKGTRNQKTDSYGACLSHNIPLKYLIICLTHLEQLKNGCAPSVRICRKQRCWKDHAAI